MARNADSFGGGNGSSHLDYQDADKYNVYWTEGLTTVDSGNVA